MKYLLLLLTIVYWQKPFDNCVHEGVLEYVYVDFWGDKYYHVLSNGWTPMDIESEYVIKTEEKK